MQRWGWVAALVVVGCSGSPGVAFIDRWSGTQTCSGTDFDGASFEGTPEAVVIDIQEDAVGAPFIAGTCTIPLRVIGDRRLEVLGSDCNTTLEGQPIVIRWDSGVLSLSEDDARMGYSINLIATAVAGTSRQTCNFEGTRAL